jgi:hypothetical protein
MWEKAEIIDIDSSELELQLKSELARTYPSGSTIYPASKSISVTSAVYSEAQDITLTRYYLTSNGKYVSWNESGYVHANPVGNPLDAQAVLDLWPQLGTRDYADNRGHTWEELMDTAWDGVRSSLLSRGQKVEMFRGASEVLRQVVLYEFGLLLCAQGTNPTELDSVADFMALIKPIYEEKREEMLNTHQWIDVSEDEVDADDGTEQGRGRSVRW